MNMKKDVFTKGLGAIAMFILSAGVVSCDVHEWPEIEYEHLKLNLVFDTEFTNQYYDYTSAVTRSEDAPVEMHYIVRAYPVVNGTTNRNEYKEVTFSRTVEEDYNCETSISLAPGDYHIIVWSEFTIDGKSYYNTDDFSKVTVDTSPYVGDTELRKTYRGKLDVTVRKSNNETDRELEGTVEMSSPMARYVFVANDLQEFIDNERSKKGGPVSLDDYYVKVRYTQFMPSAYNLFSLKPNDSLTGISFTSTLENYSSGKAALGFDYVFVNGSESKVFVQMMVYRKSDNEELARTPQIAVPTLRGVNTIVEGPFLGFQSKDGIGVDPNFEGDINIYF